MGGRPAIKIDSFGGVGRVDMLRFGLKGSIGQSQGFGISREGRSDGEETIVSARHGDVALLSIEMGMFFISQDMFRQQVSLFEGCPHEVEVSETAFEAIPIHVISTKHLGQGPVRDSKSAQKKSRLNLVSRASSVGQHKRWHNGVDPTPRLILDLEPNPSEPHLRHFL